MTISEIIIGQREARHQDGLAMSTKLKTKLLLTISALLLSMPAMAATLKIATITPNGTKWMDDMRSSAAVIKERTGGRGQSK